SIDRGGAISDHYQRSDCHVHLLCCIHAPAIALRCHCMKRFTLNKLGRLAGKDLAQVVSLLRRGEAVVLPTDTSYGLAVRVDRPGALKNAFSLKGRARAKTVSMAVRSKAQANAYGRFSNEVETLWKAFLPGPLTLVLPSRKRRFPYVRREDGTIAIRYLPTPCVKQILTKLPVPISITSANKSGMQDIYSHEQFLRQYQRGKLPAAFVDAGRLPKRNPS